MLIWLLQYHLLLIVVTGFLDLSKCIEKVIKLSLFHLDSVVMAVLMPNGEESLLITPWLKAIGAHGHAGYRNSTCVVSYQDKDISSSSTT